MSQHHHGQLSQEAQRGGEPPGLKLSQTVTLRIHFQLSSLGQVGPFYVVVAIPKDPS